MPDFIRRSDAERLSAKLAERLAEIERNVIARIVDRVGAGDDPRIATAEEVHRALSRLGAAQAAFATDLQELRGYPERPAK